VSVSGGWRDPRSRAALYRRVVEALEHSAALAERHAERHQHNGRSADATEEWDGPGALGGSSPEPARCCDER